MSRHSRSVAIIFLIVLLICPFLALAFVPSQSPEVSTSNTESIDFHGNSRLHSHLKLEYNNEHQANQTDTLIRKSLLKFGSEVQENTPVVSIEGWGSITSWELLNDALRTLDGLDEVHWNHNDAPPRQLLETLELRHPSCKLFYKLNFHNWDPYDKEYSPAQIIGDEPRKSSRAAAREGVIGSSNLYSIKTRIEYGPYPNVESMAYLQRLIESAPNLRDLDLTFDHGGCEVSNDQPRSFDFSSSATHFPPLKKLRLTWYAFDGPVDGQDRGPGYNLHTSLFGLVRLWDTMSDSVMSLLPRWFQHSMRLDGYTFVEHTDGIPADGPAENLRAWMGKMDWSALEELHLDTISSLHFRILAPALNNLKAFGLDGADAETSALVQSFLSEERNQHGLQAISLQNLRTSPSSLVETLSSHHNSSLRSVSLHSCGQRETRNCWRGLNDTSHCPKNHSSSSNSTSSSLYLDGAFLSRSDFDLLLTSCPNISHLALDLDRTLDAPELHATLTSLGRFPHLHSLGLEIDSPDALRSRLNALNNPNRTRFDALVDELESAYTSDPLFTATFVRELFSRLRSLQRAAASEQQQPPPPPLSSSSSDDEPTPPLQKLTIKLGPWDSRHDYGMLGPPKDLLGYFECTSHPSNGKDNGEECKGWYGYNSYHGDGLWAATDDSGSVGAQEIEFPAYDELWPYPGEMAVGGEREQEYRDDL